MSKFRSGEGLSLEETVAMKRFWAIGWSWGTWRSFGLRKFSLGEHLYKTFYIGPIHFNKTVPYTPEYRKHYSKQSE